MPPRRLWRVPACPSCGRTDWGWRKMHGEDQGYCDRCMDLYGESVPPGAMLASHHPVPARVITVRAKSIRLPYFSRKADGPLFEGSDLHPGQAVLSGGTILVALSPQQIVALYHQLMDEEGALNTVETGAR